MSWTDKKAVEHILKLRDTFNVEVFVETGTFMGVNARFHASNFKKVLSCEKVKEYYIKAKQDSIFYQNLQIDWQESPIYLNLFKQYYEKKKRKDTIIFYLDAHFYDPKLKPEERFVVLDELKALKDFPNCIIIIHDFDNGLGHITYDGQPLNLDLLRKDLLAVNPNFKFYTNELASCEPYTTETILDSGMEINRSVIDNLRYANSLPRLKYRGILYCTPSEVKIDGLKAIG